MTEIAKSAGITREALYKALRPGSDSDITIGASSAVLSDNPDAKLSYTEHTGTAIEAGRQSLLDLEERMRATGAELISQKQAQTTATQVNAEGDAATGP